MPAIAAQTSGPRTVRAWRNELPGWITESEAWSRLRTGPRVTLQALANVCSAPDDRGNLLNGWGGARVRRAARVSRATWWRHVAALERAGFVVLLARGGCLAGANNPNVYGIPGNRGGLDRLAARRRVQIMRRCADGVLRPEVLARGDQTTLWRPASGLPAAVATAAPRSRGLGHVDLADLRDLARLAELHARAVRARLAVDSDDGWLRFVTAAEHALRVGSRPAALFAAIVRNGEWGHVTIRDEERARRRLGAAREGRRERRTTWADELERERDEIEVCDE